MSQTFAEKYPFKKPIHSGTTEVIHSKVTLSNDPFVDPTPFRSPFEGSNYNIQEVIAPVLAHKPKRRRSRSTKRSRSTPPKLNEILVEENSYNLTAIPLVKVKSKEKQKIIEKRSYAGKPLFSPAASKYLINPPSHDKEVVTIPILVDGAYSAVSQGLNHNFPIPPGWGAMSNKKRKNRKKMWHNRQSSAVPGVFVPIRAHPSCGASLHWKLSFRPLYKFFNEGFLLENWPSCSVKHFLSS